MKGYVRLDKGIIIKYELLLYRNHYYVLITRESVLMSALWVINLCDVIKCELTFHHCGGRQHPHRTEDLNSPPRVSVRASEARDSYTHRL